MALKGITTGNVGQEPELKFNPQGKAILEISVNATPSKFDKQTNQWQDIGDPIWIRASIWERDAEKLAGQIHKGDRVSIEGTLSIRSYQRTAGGQGISYELLGAKFLGVIPRAPQNAAQPFAGAPNSPAPGYSGTPGAKGPQNGTQDVFGNAGGGSFDDNPPF